MTEPRNSSEVLSEVVMGKPRAHRWQVKEPQNL